VRAKAHRPNGAGLANFRKLGLYGAGWKAPPNAGIITVCVLSRGAPPIMSIPLAYPRGAWLMWVANGCPDSRSTFSEVGYDIVYEFKVAGSWRCREADLRCLFDGMVFDSWWPWRGGGKALKTLLMQGQSFWNQQVWGKSAKTRNSAKPKCGEHANLWRWWPPVMVAEIPAPCFRRVLLPCASPLTEFRGVSVSLFVVVEWLVC
jgi:hypothetical protein